MSASTPIRSRESYYAELSASPSAIGEFIGKHAGGSSQSTLKLSAKLTARKEYANPYSQEWEAQYPDELTSEQRWDIPGAFLATILADGSNAVEDADEILVSYESDKPFDDEPIRHRLSVAGASLYLAGLHPDFSVEELPISAENFFRTTVSRPENIWSARAAEHQTWLYTECRTMYILRL